MTPKIGRDHLESLRDGRALFYRGERVADVTAHPAFRQAVATAAGLYDLNADPALCGLLTYESPDTGRPVSRMWQLPESREALVGRRAALERWAESHCGFLGRSPDHVASCISGMVMGIEAFDERAAGALRDYYRYARDNDLYLTYAIINPQTDRGQGAAGQAEDLVLRWWSRMRAASPCAGRRCWRPAPSWPTRSSFPASSPCRRGRRRPSPSPSSFR